MEHALASPASVFADPSDVLTAPGLERSARLRILRQWELDARRLEASEAEGMEDGEPAQLRRVLLALAELDQGA